MGGIVKPKRLPRKLKKRIIKSWGRNTYHGVMKGYIYLLPWIIEHGEPILEECNSEPLNKEIKSRYSKVEFN